MSKRITHSADTTLKILVIDETPIRRAILDAGLKEAGYSNVTLLATSTGLIDHIAAAPATAPMAKAVATAVLGFIRPLPFL